ncbi:MAG TPA: P-loop NTPase [Candidatus Limnocylindria bacterium]|nr:P-loop NTPase [Candidatus Limnocylindria bacterium]
MTFSLPVVLVHRDDYERGQLRAALEALPGIQIVGERSDLRSGLALARQVRPGILILDLVAPVEDTLQAAAQYKLDHHDCAIFLASEVFDPETLLRALRAGAQEVLRRPLDRGALREAVERVTRQLAKKSGASSTRGVMTVFSNKGGSGVSTLAANLALSLRRHTGREVALADFDYQSGDAGFMLGLSPTRSLADILSAPNMDSASVQAALMKHDSGLFVLSQPEHLDRVDGVTAQQMAGVLDMLASMFDYVVVDAPHVFNDITLEVFDRSTQILLMTEPSIPSVRAARRSFEIFNKLNFMVSNDRVRLIVNRRSDQSAITIPQIEETLGVPVFGSIANDYASVSRAINVGKPLCGDNVESRAGRDIAGLARKLVPTEVVDESVEAVPVKRPARLRLFGKG